MATTLIVGLGNAEPQYDNTRHNLGIMLLSYLAKKNDADLSLDKKLGAWMAKTSFPVGGKKRSVVLARLESFVNTSGPIVAKLKLQTKAKAEDIIIIHDDLDIPFGNVKLSFDKNSGGHRGIESIMKALKTKKFFRLRLGIATNALKKAYQQNTEKKDEFIKDFVLSKFSPKEKDLQKKIFAEAEKLLESSGTQLSQ